MKIDSNREQPGPSDFSFYRGSRVMVTGGLGFIGSNLAIRLVELGADVVIVDSQVEGCGANSYNVACIAGQVQIVHKDIAEAAAFRRILEGMDVIFNLAGEISHRRSMEFPERDAAINAGAQLLFLKECVAAAPGARLVYAGTRQIYGVARYLPVDEDHPVNPVDFNGVHKRAAMMYHLLFAREGRLDAVVLNLTNVYGPRMAVQLVHQGVLSNFIRRTIAGEPLELYGDGQQLRDPLYVDDAVEAFLLAGSVAEVSSRIYNVGGPRAMSIREIAETMQRTAASQQILFKPFPPRLKSIDVGSYYADWRRIQRELGWAPRTDFEEGLRKTLAYYKKAALHYMPHAASAAAAQ